MAKGKSKDDKKERRVFTQELMRGEFKNKAGMARKWQATKVRVGLSVHYFELKVGMSLRELKSPLRGKDGKARTITSKEDRIKLSTY